MSTRNYLVCGDTGLIGSHLTDELCNRGYYVRATYHQSTPRRDPLIEHHQVDLRKEEDCLHMCKGVDYVFMAAAVTSGAHDMVHNPLVHVTDNIIMNTRMLDAAYRQGVKLFTFISSSSIYPDMGEEPCREEHAWVGNPHPKYWWVAWMKKMAEILCISYATQLQRKMKTCIIRPSNTYGPHDKFDPIHSHFIPNKIRELEEYTDPLVIWGTGDEIRDYIYVDDLARGIADAAEFTDDHPQVEYTDFNIASGQPITIGEVAHLLVENSEYDPEIVFDDTKPTTIPIRVLDISRARDILQFEPRVDIKTGLRRTFMWYRQKVEIEKYGLDEEDKEPRLDVENR